MFKICTVVTLAAGSCLGVIEGSGEELHSASVVPCELPHLIELLTSLPSDLARSKAIVVPELSSPSKALLGMLDSLVYFEQLQRLLHL